MISCIIIDDDRNTTRVFLDILELMGLEVRGVGHDGEDAVLLYKEHHPDIAFIDVVMHGTDGFYAAKKIMDFDPDAKIVAVTADLTTDTLQKLESIRVHAIIYKPFSQEQIRNVLLEKYKIRL
ncbi:MAG: response regulator [Nitrososphaerota archaeon]|nr:response regulator [Nitrososphaerota archaeon]